MPAPSHPFRRLGFPDRVESLAWLATLEREKQIDTARRLGINQGNVSRAASRAAAKIENLLERRCFTRAELIREMRRRLSA